ncbi:MAG: hypothetical protein Q8O26_08270 [Phreatobacter sp.]|uniref:beta strand repeat-containing protein n=1 Tax=Phreatobacter sp. TaxID=1966341 RepID=UPI0027342DAC|nr:hypothetical protein [Phreatobacter sp.]MDP2801862.1 hypothetical protein [Phreatobacter sp.]
MTQLRITAIDANNDGQTYWSMFNNSIWNGYGANLAGLLASGTPVAVGSFVESQTVTEIYERNTSGAIIDTDYRVNWSWAYTVEYIRLSPEFTLDFDDVVFSDSGSYVLESNPGSLPNLSPVVNMASYINGMSYYYTGTGETDYVDLTPRSSGGVLYFLSGGTADGGGGNDFMTGRIGHTLIGGEGRDTLSLDLTTLAGPVTFTVAGAQQLIANTGSGLTSVSGFEIFSDLRLTAGNDVFDLRGSGGNVSVSGNSSNITGGAGTDLLMVDSSSRGFATFFDFERLEADFSNSALFVTATSSSVSLRPTSVAAAVLQLGQYSGTIGSMNVIGGSSDDFISGSAGADVLNGGGGNDTMSGGIGDTLIGGEGRDVLTLDLTALAGPVTFTVAAGQQLVGSNANGLTSVSGFEAFSDLRLTAGDDVFDLRGSGGNVSVSGNGSTILGGAGTDRLLVDSPSRGFATFFSFERLEADFSASAMFVTATSSSVILRPTSTAAAVLQLGQNSGQFGSMHVIGGSRDDIISGSAGADMLSGGLGNDRLTGGDDADLFTGGGGNDIIDGGAGSDAALFSLDRASYYVRTVFSNGQFSTQVTAIAGTDGIDTLAGVEALGFGGGAFGLAGVQQNLSSNMDGSYFDDVLFQNSATGQIIFQNMTAGTGSGFANVLGSLPAGWRLVGSDDFTGDGRADTLVQDTNTGSIYTVNIASGAPVWGVVSTGLTSAFQAIASGDVTRDGTADVLVRDTATGINYIADMNAGGTFGGWVLGPNLGTGWRTVGLGDFNRDGASDVLVQNIADGTTYYRDVANSQWGFVSGAVGSPWVARESADINGDGFADVVFRNTSTSDIWWVNMLGGSNSGWGVVANGLAGWDVRGSADVDNDGWRDVIVQNQSNGTTYFADMNAGAFGGWGTVSGALGTQWLAVA